MCRSIGPHGSQTLKLGRATAACATFALAGPSKARTCRSSGGHMRRNPIAGSAVVIALALAFGIGAEDITRATRGVINLPRVVPRNADDFNWHGALRPGATLEVKGVNGDVTRGSLERRRGAGHRAAVRTTGQPRERAARGGRARRRRHHLRGLPEQGCGPAKRMPPRHRGADERAEQRRQRALHRAGAARACVSPGARSTARWTRRACRARSSLATVNGSAGFSTSSYGEASTVNGSIRGAMGASDWSEGLAFKTVNGTITLDLPAGSQRRGPRHDGERRDLHRFPARRHRAPQPRVTCRAPSASGGRRLDLETVNGSVRLRRR